MGDKEVIFSPISLLHNGFHLLENLLLGAALVPGPGLPGPGRNLEGQALTKCVVATRRTYEYVVATRRT